MQVRNFRSLDQPPSVLNIKGDMIIIPGIGAGLGLILALAVSKFLDSVFAICTFLLVLGTSYGLTLLIQGRMSERDFKLTLASKMIVKNILVKPVPFSTILSKNAHDKKHS